MVVAADRHSVMVRGADPTRHARGPLLLERTEHRVVPAVLAVLGGTDGLRVVANSRAAMRDQHGMLRLYQPIHRTFYVALLEVVCDVFGQPRLDPRKIARAGLVIRRRTGQSGGVEGWRQVGTTLRGWVGFADETEARMDPDPKYRAAPAGAGHLEIDRRLALRHPFVEQLSESFSPLFVAKPDICDATGRTLLCGLVRLTSAEQNETPTSPPAYGDDQINALRAHFPRFLQSGKLDPKFSLNDRTVTPKDAATLEADPGASKFMMMLRQLAIELNVFGGSPFGSNPQSVALYQEINKLTLTFADGSKRGAAEFLADATRVLIEREPGSSVVMPKEWPAVDGDQAERIFKLSLTTLNTQFANIAPRAGRFDDLDRQYVARAFVRLKPESPDCPTETVWSDYSEPFTIAPWYETGNAAPVRIVLPDASDRDALKKLKPNVSFVVPPKLFNCINNRLPGDWLKGLVDESCSSSGGITLMWICSFSLPIITLCAFIVLSIFLALFDLIFRWLLFIKICIPFPVPKKL